MEAVEIRSAQEVANDIKSCVKQLNAIVREAEFERGLTVMLDIRIVDYKNKKLPEVTTTITKVY